MDTRDSTYERPLSDGWMIQASSGVKQPPAMVSGPAFDAQGWYSTSVPSTVLAALVDNAVYADPYFGMNLSKIPPEPFAEPWWYRTQFQLPDGDAEKTVLLEFDGINYSANIWLNGRKVAHSSEVRGAFRRFHFDVSTFVREHDNVLAVEVLPPKPGDFSTGFVDWNPPAPDGNMGLFRSVRLRLCDGISIEHPFVQSHLNSPDDAVLVISAELVNHTDHEVSGVLKGDIESVSFSRTVEIGPRGRKKIEFSDVSIANPRLWWPHDLGTPHLYDLHLKFAADQKTCDVAVARFGIREVEDYRNEAGHRGFKINGREILIKGTGWTDDLFLADTAQSIDAQLRYVRHMNLNCIRFEGIWGKDHTLYDLCDEYGILAMVGWSCHWEHQQYLGKPVDGRYGGVTSAEDIDLISKSWRDQLLWLRNHPSIFVWAVGSDKVPAPELEKKYIETFEQYDPTRSYLASTGGVGSEQGIIGDEMVVSEISGCPGVKMLGPYAYTPPVYWYTDTTRGGAYGFNTETCPGAVVPPLESLRKMLGEDHLWPIDEVWEFHCALNAFHTLDRYCEAIDKRYGGADNVEQFALKAQALNYELIRPMFEAFRANRGKATGVIQWMLNAAWPKMYWQLYDKSLMPTGAFYGTKKACQPLHLLYNYGDHGVYAVNDHAVAVRGVRVTIRVLNIDSAQVLCETLGIDLKPDSSAKIFDVPEFGGETATYFLDLRFDGEPANFYWLSNKPDVLDYEAVVEPWPYYTPCKEYADLTALNSLPDATVEIAHAFTRVGQDGRIEVRLSNVGEHVAFLLELKVRNKSTGETVLPVFWEDNYVSLLPGESRNINAVFPDTGTDVEFDIDGWNLKS